MNLIMKRLSYFIYILFSVIFIVSCSKDDKVDTPQQVDFKIDQATVSVPESSSVKVKVSAPAGIAWKVTTSGAYWFNCFPLQFNRRRRDYPNCYKRCLPGEKGRYRICIYRGYEN